MKRGAQTREQRLAAALRENLKRRKARTRALDHAEAAQESTEAPAQSREATTKRD